MDARSDEVRDYGLDLTWQPRRQIAVILSGQRIERDSNLPGFAYDEWVGGLALRVTLDPLAQ